ncbi:MAG: type III-B CRISPR module RAMP protein Cmr1 [Endomicrobiia bacterium]
MKTVKFECEVITPMFLCGADGRTAELRPPSIKGLMRFWWRALKGLEDIAKLREEESKRW